MNCARANSPEKLESIVIGALNDVAFDEDVTIN
jgi:hypothetical protein